MKVTLSTILLLGASVSQALAVAEPEAAKGGKTGFCGVPGASCSKRDAEPEPAKGGKTGFCGVPGASCSRLKRSAEALIEAFNEPYDNKPSYSFCDIQGEACANAAEQIRKVGEVAERSYDSAILAREAAKGGRTGFCGVPGASCSKRDASPEPAKGGKTGFCGVPGASCSKARDLEANLFARAKGGKTGFCGVPGASCSKRDAEPEPAKGGKTGFCGVPGASCSKRDAEPEPAKGGKTGFCGVPGASCSKRDLDSALNAVRAVKAWEPSVVRAPCYQEGGECAAILKAHSQFHQLKREAAAISTLDANAKKAFCATHDCDEHAHALLKTPEHEHKRAEEDCNAADGDCTVADRALTEIESSLNEAVASLSE